MLITASALQSLRTTVRMEFAKALANVEPQYQLVATVVPSTSKSNTYGWIGAMPSFREWVGDRVVNSVKEHGYSITNKTWENTIGINRDDVEDDNIGMVPTVVQSLAQEGAEFPDELVFGLLPNGFTTACYDGQNFFDTDHPVNSKHDGTGADSSVANMVDETGSGYTGEPWYLLDTSRPLKPLIFQDRRKLAINTLFNPTDPAVWTSNEFEFGADMRCEAGYGFWQMAFGNKRDLTAANLWDSWKRMRAFTRDGGKKLKIRPNLLVVPPSLEEEATKLLERDFIDEGGVTVKNEMKGKVKLLVVDVL
ncbi:Mu-like prophage major head subunit gpT family protein [Gallaecimonas kandeliae]|uniref:Mu-like prophage major head subunit gpT family protein n=1 Tax=Gallaecimonas kandeliae TaxID=3029055 RepID=UPI002648DDE3|nr:Mu-like prophage major head subunit gpT family protein [Gallaecimonas kandeliae]WKE64339.1 Mu-like prophage major head subunit gpT family protein [Gallaecimonas kandeliae]